VKAPGFGFTTLEPSKCKPGFIKACFSKFSLCRSGSENGVSARRERDVVQYYQYSADMGNADAATAIGWGSTDKPFYLSSETVLPIK
jgi:hypothetical protein